MQLKKRIYSTFVVLLLIASGIMIFLCTNFLSPHTETPEIPLPSNTDWVIRLDVEKLMKQEVYNTLFSKKDEQLLNQLRAMMDERSENEFGAKKLHINLNEDFVFYQFRKNAKRFVAISLKTSDPESFNAQSKKLKDPNLAGMANGSNAVFLMQQSGGKTSKSEFESIFNAIFQSPHRKFKKQISENEFFTFEISNLSKAVDLNNTTLSVLFEENKLNLEGKTIYTSTTTENLHFGLKAKGLCLYSQLIPEKLTDTLLYFLPDSLPHFKDIQAFAVDFQGTYLEDPIDELPNLVGFLPTPVMNLIIQTKAPCKVEDLWKSFPEKVRKKNLELDLGHTIYYFRQLNPNTYFIGVDPRAVIPYSGKEIFSLSGNLLKTTQVFGSTFVTTFIENMGPIKAINEFLSSSKHINLTISKSKGQTCNIKGEIQFKADKHPIHEMTKLVIGMRNLIN